mmetsp:Transcript_9538/g.25630  ORF Transcript_9538/g.25630 Transcript_9538/m.25630 type:complete len:200 (-) Transcript_9538:299-898(-)
MRIRWVLHVASTTVHDVPLHAAKVDAPEITGPRRVILHRVVQFQTDERQSELDAPATVAYCRVVDGTAHARTCHERRHHVCHVEAVRTERPRAVLSAAVAVWLVQREVPRDTERVDFRLLVVRVRAADVYEHLEVVIMKNYVVVLRDVRPHVRFLELRGDVQRIVRPSYFCARFKAWFDMIGDIDERFCERHLLPRDVV